MRREDRTRRRQGKRKKLQQISRVKHILIFSLGGLLVAVAALLVALKLTAPPDEGTTSVAMEDSGTAQTAAADSGQPSLTPNPDVMRNLAHEAQDVRFDKEGQINQPGIWGTELFFSAGSGSLDDPVLTRLYLYSLTTTKAQKIKETEIYKGEYYETLINDKWLIYLETDHGTNNYIYAMSRADSKVTLIKNCKNGKPKLRLYGDTLIWMEQDQQEDKLYMVDLVSQENLPLFTFSDVATYGTSAPSIYGAWIVWSGPDPEPVSEDTVTSAIYYINLDEDIGENGIEPRVYRPDTYVHEPLFNGQYFAWIDTNKSFNATLYVAQPNTTPVTVASGISAYGLGDGFVVYGKDNGIYLYIIATGETCRLTDTTENGILPQVYGRTVIWQNKSIGGGRDVLRYKILTDEELYPGGLPEGVEPYTAETTTAATTTAATTAAETTPQTPAETTATVETTPAETAATAATTTAAEGG